MESNIKQAYLIRDEKAQAANTAKRVGALLAALCADVADHNTRVAEIEESVAETKQSVAEIEERVAETKERVTGIEESVAETKERVTGIEESVAETKERVTEIEKSKDDLPAIDISAGFAVLDSYNAYDKCGIYRLTISDGAVTAGILVVTSDNMGHVIDQWLVGNYIITDGVGLISHTDGAHTICVRSYGIIPSSSAVTQGQWTAWEYALCIDPTHPKEESKDDLPAIDISAGFAVLDSYNAYDKCGIYRLTAFDGVITAGILVVTSDNNGHVIDQWLVGNYTIRDGAVTGEHRDTAHTLCVRSYGMLEHPGVTKGQWTAWEYALCIDPTQPKEAYAKVVKWSGKVVDGILLQQLSAGAGTRGQVVWDKGHKTFAFETTSGAYFNNWGTRTDYQTGMWTADAGQWSAGLKAGVFYSGDDGSLWVATSAAELERLTGSDVVDGELSADSENAVSNAAVTEAIIKTNSWTTEE